MQANELRIGNLIKGTDLKDIVVVDIEVLKIMSYHFYNGSFEPIPLTREILASANIDLITSLFRIIKIEDNCMLFEVNGYFIKKEFVHQLQNLYFELTGHELQIKLNPNLYD